jgi:dTDP-4-dehydrorhamnose reductase
MTKILITGGNGYIAKGLYNNLKLIHDITLITREECELTNFHSVNSYFHDKYFDVIVHCAVDGGLYHVVYGNMTKPPMVKWLDYWVKQVVKTRY